MYSPNLDVDKVTARMQWRVDCERNAREVDQLVQQLIDQGNVPLEDLELRYFVVARIGIAEHLVDHLFWYESGDVLSPVSAFLPVSSEIEKMLRVLLIDWWWEKGLSLAFDRLWDGALLDGSE